MKMEQIAQANRIIGDIQRYQRQLMFIEMITKVKKQAYASIKVQEYSSPLEETIHMDEFLNSTESGELMEKLERRCKNKIEELEKELQTL